MSYIVTTLWYPLSKADEVGKTYLKAIEKFPEDESIMKPVIRAAITTNKKGLKVFTVAEAIEGKLSEALKRDGDLMREFWGIEGLNYKTRVLATLEEGLEALGLI